MNQQLGGSRFEVVATDTVTPTDGPTGASTSSASGYVQPEVDVPALTRLLDGRYAEVRNLVRSNLSAYSSILTDAETLSRADYRERVKELVVEMASTGQTGMGFPEEYGGGGDIGASIAAFETLSFGDLSVLVKVGVQFGLFGGAILQLGTERHHEEYLRPLMSGELMGCFAMTETGHGSNVQALGTVATYDVATQEFVITTTREDARKDYIGNAAEHGELAVVFAQLEVGGEGRGVHAFVVPIRVRDDSGELVPAPGVTIADDGLKMGLNGVDNGRLWFDEVRVPRDNLLNRFADVTPAGVYESPIDNPNRRFFTMLGTLIQGRVCVGGAGINAAKVALTIAVKYALRRRQFEASGEEEELLLDYGMHQRRLLPLLARTYALHFAQDVLSANLHDVLTGVREDEQTQRELESRAAGTKALGTWHATRTIQECREACGGAGYLAENRFAALKADTDVFTTFEGDNHVLLQLVAKGLLTDYASEFEDMDQLDLVRFVGGLAVEIVEYEPTGCVERPVVEAAEVDGVGVVDRATVEQGTQPRFPAHEAHRVAPDGLQSVCVEHCRRRVEVGDQPQPRLEVDADDRVGRLLALDQVDGAVAGHEGPTAGRGAQAEAAERLDVGPGKRPVPGRDPLREVDGVEPPERLGVGGELDPGHGAPVQPVVSTASEIASKAEASVSQRASVSESRASDLSGPSEANA